MKIKLKFHVVSGAITLFRVRNFQNLGHLLPLTYRSKIFLFTKVKMFRGAVTALKMPSKKYFARGKLKFQAQIPEKVGGPLLFCDRFLG